MVEYKKWIEGLQKGSYSDFRTLYDAFSGNLYGFIFGLVKSDSLTKDIVQETFLRVWLNRSFLDPQLSFKAYLFKISQNLIIDNFRRQMSNPLFVDYLDYCDELISDANTIEQELDFDLFHKHLKIAKTKLTPRQREIFELNKEQGIPTSEISERLNISEQTIYNQISSALKILKKELSSLDFLLFFIFLY
jgi:RNA polymerase sigma-70 factor (ECF subfamily)